MKRREFIGKLGTLAAGLALADIPVIGQQGQESSEIFERIRYDRDWPYPKDSMDSAERVWFEGSEAWVNVLPKKGKEIDIRLYASDSKEKLGIEPPIRNLTGVRDSLDMCVGEVYSPRLHYKIEYREGKGPWRSLAPHEVKTPRLSLENGDKVRIIIKSDDHVASDLKYEPEYKEWRGEWLRGDYVTTMMREILDNPNYYRPEFQSEKAVHGFTSAWQSLEILKRNPDLVIDNGDTVGHDWYRIWGTDGKWPELQPYLNLTDQSDILWGRKRRAEAGVTPEVSLYLALGNHDGEVSWSNEKQPFTQPYARSDRKKYWGQPGINNFFPVSPVTRISSKEFRIPGFDNNQNYFPIHWVNGDVMLLILDVNSYLERKPEQVTDWTLGDKQKLITENILSQNYHVPWKFISFHNPLGGYSLGSGLIEGAYGRGPVFTMRDYEKVIEISKNNPDVPAVDYDPREVEQVWLTGLAKDTNVRGFVYGHDHVFFYKLLEELTSEGKKMFAACAGSTKYAGSKLYENICCNPYWKEFYGEGRKGFKDPPDFHTPPGFTELEIDKDGANIRYICSAPTLFMGTCNMPEWKMPGDVVCGYRIDR